MQKKRNNLIESPTFTKILSFLLALILWFFVAGDRQETSVNEIRRQFENIPLSCRSLGDDLVVVEMTDSVKVTLQGIQPSFDGLTPADLEAYVNLSGKKEGRHEVRIEASAPPGMSIVRIEPASTIVVLEDLIALQMPVEPMFLGKNRSGMIIDETDFEPQQVFVQGPRHKVELTERVIFYFDIESAKGFVRESVTLYPVDSIGRIVNGVTVSPEFVNVEVSMAFPRKEIPVEAVLKDYASGLEVETVSIDPPVVAVQGPQKILDDVQVIRTEEIDLDGWESGTAKEIPLIFPEEIEPVTEDHRTVHVSIFFAED